MYSRFVATSNVKRFLGGVAAVEERSAPEASLMLAAGDAGHGKSRTGQWWATQNNAVFIRIKAAATPHWFLTDLVRELGNTAPMHSCEKLYGQAIGILVREPRPIVVDEVENALHDIKVIETIRDISDMAEIPVVMVGREFVQGALRRHPQIWSRISSLVLFNAVTIDDVSLCAKQLCEVEISDDLVREIHAQSEGRVREVVKALGNVERVGKRHGGKKMTLADLKGVRLTQDFQASRRGAAQVAA